MPSDTFGNRLAVMRHELELSLEEAADRAGLKRATWRTWERGLAKPRDMAHVVTQIAESFGYDAMWLMWGGPLGGEQPDGDPDKGSSTRGRPDSGSTAEYDVVEITPGIRDQAAELVAA